MKQGSPFRWQVELKLEGQVGCCDYSKRCPTELKDLRKYLVFMFLSTFTTTQEIIYDSRCRWILIKHTRIFLILMLYSVIFYLEPRTRASGSYSNCKSIVSFTLCVDICFQKKSLVGKIYANRYTHTPSTVGGTQKGHCSNVRSEFSTED